MNIFIFYILTPTKKIIGICRASAGIEVSAKIVTYYPDNLGYEVKGVTSKTWDTLEFQ